MPGVGAGDVTAVVVHYRNDDQFDRCLSSCLAIDRIAAVTVVDNEGDADALRGRQPDPRLTVVAMPRNAGFGAAANVGLVNARTPMVLVFNEDVELSAAALDAMVEAGERAGAWIVAPRQRDDHGIERPRKTSFSPPLSWYPPDHPKGNWWFVPYVSGAALLFMPGHTDLRFDERFFQFAEDEDLGYRVWAAGGAIIEVTDAWAVHAVGAAPATRWTPGLRAAQYRVLANQARFVRKHAGVLGVASWSRHVLRSTLRMRR